MIRLTLPTLAITLLAGPALGAISLDIVPVDNSALLTGYNTFDLQMNTPDSDWVSSVMLLETTAGSIYQHTPGVDGIQNPAALPFFYPGYPAIVFDTYVIGNVAAGGGDLDGSTGYAFDTGRLDVSWYNTTRTDIGSFPISRITLSDDAVGSWTLLSTTADKHRFTLTGSITAGVIAIETETIQVPTLSAMSLVSSVDGKTLITKTVTDSVRALAGNGYAGDAVYEVAVRDILINLLIDEMDRQQSVGPTETIGFENLTPLAPGTTALYSESNKIRSHYELYTLTESEYLQSIAIQSNEILPEPGTVVLLGFGTAALLRRRR